MTVSKLRVTLDQLGSHREMPRDLIGVLLAQRFQLVARDAIEVLGRDLLGDLRVVMTRANGAQRPSLLLFLTEFLNAVPGTTIVPRGLAVACPKFPVTVALRATVRIRAACPCGPTSTRRTARSGGTARPCRTRRSGSRTATSRRIIASPWALRTSVLGIRHCVLLVRHLRCRLDSCSVQLDHAQVLLVYCSQYPR